MKTKRARRLRCGCCGYDFRTWPAYVDQDQDKGYGICRQCQAEAEQTNAAMLDRVAEQIDENLSPENAARFAAMTPDARRGLAWQMIESGHVTWRIMPETPIRIM